MRSRLSLFFTKVHTPSVGTRCRASGPSSSSALLAAFYLLAGILFSSVGGLPAGAQPSAATPLDPQLQLMLSQPPVDISSNVEASVSFDPPVVRPGEKSIYRVTLNALDDSIQWSEQITNMVPELNLQFSARGQTLVPENGKWKPQTTINYHVRPGTNGVFTIPEFPIQVYGHQVTVPSGRLEVVQEISNSHSPSQLDLEIAATNVYLGQAINVRVLLRSSTPNVVSGLMNVRLNGDGFMVDQSAWRQNMGPVSFQGRSQTASVSETTLTPLAGGRLTVSAQAYTFGNRFSGPVVIQGGATVVGGTAQYLLVDSDPVTLDVRPLPQVGRLPGFTGAIGKFSSDPPQLLTNQVRVGDSVSLVVTFHGEGNLSRLVPPPPPASDSWQVFAAVPGVVLNLPLNSASAGATFTYTLVPLTSDTKATPSLPFSYFDPDRGEYVDLTIPSVPVTVLAGPATADSQLLQEMNQSSKPEEKPTLSALAPDRGRSNNSLTPLQERASFIFIQLLPLFGFAGLWGWERRRRYLEQHPGIVLRRRARRALRHRKRELLKAFEAGDSLRCAHVAIQAMRVAAAPHYPAEPEALVCRDVLHLLPGTNEKTGETVRRFFTIADASQFSAQHADAAGLLALRSELEQVIEILEAKL
jgi:hypothetical protein